MIIEYADLVAWTMEAHEAKSFHQWLHELQCSEGKTCNNQLQNFVLLKVHIRQLFTLIFLFKITRTHILIVLLIQTPT